MRRERVTLTSALVFDTVICMDNREMAALVDKMNQSLKDAQERREQWAANVGTVEDYLRQITQQVNTALAPSKWIKLHVETQTDTANMKHLDVTLGRFPLGVIIGAEKRPLVEVGAALSFRPTITGRVQVTFREGGLDMPNASWKVTVLDTVEPVTLINVEKVRGYVGQFLHRAVDEHWTKEPKAPTFVVL